MSVTNVLHKVSKFHTNCHADWFLPAPCYAVKRCRSDCPSITMEYCIKQLKAQIAPIF